MTTAQKTPTKQPTTTKKKAPLAPKAKKPAPSKKTLEPKKETPTPEPVEAVKPATPEPAPEPKNEEGFSKAEVDELKINLDMLPDTVNGTVLQNGEATEETETPESEENTAEQTEEDQQADIMPPEVAEQMAKDMFYMGLCGGSNLINGRLTKDSPFGPYKAFSLKNHGPAGRAASDQFFDRLCDIPLLKKYLLKLSDQKAFMSNWGAICTLGVSAFMMFKEEQQARFDAAKMMAEKEASQAASNDNEETEDIAA